MYSYGWDDACWTECGFGEERPLRFENIEQAEAAIVELLADVRAAVAAGHMVCEEQREDYRVREVPQCGPQLR
jgi:hypothetical protein